MDLFDLVAKISLDASEYESGIQSAESETQSFGSKVTSGIGTVASGVAKAVGGMTLAVAGVSTAMVGVAGSVATYGDDIDKSSQKLGISSKAYQEWEAVLQHSGTSMSSMSASFKKLANASQDASDDQVKAFERIGLSMEEVANMSTEELWSRTIAGLQGMEEGTERTAVASDLLGKGATELGALLNTSAEETQGMIDKVNELGGVMSEEDVKASAKFKDSLQDLTTGFTSIKNEIGSALLPSLTDFMNFAIDNLPKIKEKFDEIFSPIMDSVSEIVDYISEHFGEISTVVDTVLTAVGEAFQLCWDTLKVIFDALSEAFTEISSSLEGTSVDWSSVWETISSIVSSAGEVIALIIQRLAQVISWLITQTRTQGTIFNAIWEAIKIHVSTVIAVVKGILNTLVALLKGDFKGAFDSAKSTVTTVLNAIKNIFDTVFAPIKETVTNVLNAIKDKFTSIFDSVKNTVRTAIDTIKNMMNFSWKLPDLKLPHFTVTGGKAPWGFMGQGSLPTVSVSWYKRAMDNPLLLSGATIFGSSGDKLLGGGEAGAEIVIGQDKLLSMIAEASGQGNNKILSAIYEELHLMNAGMYDTITSALNGMGVNYNERELARLVRKYA